MTRLNIIGVIDTTFWVENVKRAFQTLIKQWKSACNYSFKGNSFALSLSISLFQDSPTHLPKRYWKLLFFFSLFAQQFMACHMQPHYNNNSNVTNITLNVWSLSLYLTLSPFHSLFYSPKPSMSEHASVTCYLLSSHSPCPAATTRLDATHSHAVHIT